MCSFDDNGFYGKSIKAEIHLEIEYNLMNVTTAMENSTLATNHSECYHVDSEFRRRSFLFFYLAIIITSIPSNVFSLFVSWQQMRLKNELGVYVFNLALSDLAFAVGLLLWIDFLWRGVWVHGGRMCVLSLYCLYTNFYTSEAFLCCIAVDRYMAVVHPFKYTSLRKVGTAAVVTVAIWIFVSCFNAVTIMWEDSYHEHKKSSECFDIFHPLSENLVRANVVRFFVGFIVPGFLLLFSTWGIRVAVKSNQATGEQERRRISRLLAGVLLCVFFCFGPYHVIMLLRTQLDDCRTVAWLLYPHKISTAISSLNCLADPLLYCLITRTGQTSISQVVVFFQGKKRNNEITVQV
ncbi:psychosine receptor-like [Mugil cephalus]|uniref:psychosine receptor-like n=1 Tax=Mugil cephalus TaxID=48193 RepID=UPI001FB80F1C|nr:psychosine receptor-like [Mugil cephalus]